MPLGNPSFEDVIEHLQKGKGDGTDEVFRRFAARLTGVSAARLRGQGLRRRLDPEDIVQSVFGSFFRRFAAGEFTAEGWDALWAILVLMAVRKCSRRSAGHRASCRDIRREGGSPAGGVSPGWDAVDREPTPEEAAELVDLVECLLARLSAEDQQILKMRLDEVGPAEIASKVGLSQATVFRRLVALRREVQVMWEA